MDSYFSKLWLVGWRFAQGDTSHMDRLKPSYFRFIRFSIRREVVHPGDGVSTTDSEIKRKWLSHCIRTLDESFDGDDKDNRNGTEDKRTVRRRSAIKTYSLGDQWINLSLVVAWLHSKERYIVRDSVLNSIASLYS
ncbi:hypothetical protein CBL_10707 [Carabus blaptoides fortunei]